uniref:DH domain-containing protein n=1 Tax=Rhabditophanes sp. KR3021 TaxID=114890 RepID=A0AC35TJB6_9BILA
MMDMARWKHLFASWNPEDTRWLKDPKVRVLTSKLLKKQNILREFITTERNHCEILILLQQYFHANLKKERIFVNEGDVQFISPLVLETLLKFHLNLLEKLKKRMEEGVVIITISDIIVAELSNNGMVQGVLRAYTELCSSKEKCKKMYDFNLKNSPKFRHYCAKYNADPKYKHKDFKSCLDLVAQRITKYPLLFDAITKAEANHNLYFQEKKAAEVVKNFVGKIDESLSMFEIYKRWEAIRQHVDRTSIGKFEGSLFSLNDLLFQDSTDPRKVLCIGRVSYKGVEATHSLILVLFDDILVLFVFRGGRIYFFDLDKHYAVLNIQKTLVRKIERQNAVSILYNDKRYPDLVTVCFNNLTDLEQWNLALETAKKQPIGNIRKAPVGNSMSPPFNN